MTYLEFIFVKQLTKDRGGVSLTLDMLKSKQIAETISFLEKWEAGLQETLSIVHDHLKESENDK